GDRADRLAVESGDLEFHHAPSCGAGAASAGAAEVSGGAAAGASPEPSSANRDAPGCGASLRSALLTASRTVVQPPLPPGTAPSTSMRPRAVSVCTTLRLSVVTRSTPRWPAIFLFLNVLPGS